MTKPLTPELREELKEGARQVKAYGDAIRRFDAKYPDAHIHFPDKWVAIHNDDILTADTLDDVLAELDCRKIPRERTHVRFIDSDPDAFYYPG